MKAYYKNLNGGDMVSNGENFGLINMAGFGYVLVNWQGINPEPLPPVCYPANLWDLKFGFNYAIIK